MHTLCVYCGSRLGSDPAFAAAAGELGSICARKGIDIVYGGGRAGLMGTLAEAALAAGGRVIGIIPQFMEGLELAHPGLTRLEVVNTMHERKHRMATLADAFVALPGGIGTLEELAEILAWRQLALHHKPVGLLNTNGFYAPLLHFLNSMGSSDFLPSAMVSELQVAPSAEELLQRLG
ncbi:MAG: TIGR00730 family Rossman fold protein [Puniceicoccales bacterium]|jgi:uncharacterized protein (TIGR00730 family)|nr:TIGR00730 family Rossman fold protein [Puniceicoccales bacterium]